MTLPDDATPRDTAEDPCASLSPGEQARLWRAACLLADQRGVVPRMGAWLGGQADRVVGILGEGWRDRVQALVEDALWRAQGLATLGLDAPPPAEAGLGMPEGDDGRTADRGAGRLALRGWLARVATTASGAATGFVGLPGVAVDIPFSTLTILRSIAEIARAEGEDVTTDEGRRACLEVLAIGGPGARPPGMTAADSEDEAGLGYWTARLGLAALNYSAVVPQAARMLGAALSEKIIGQAVPLAGAVAGAGLNYMFIRYYQEMARVHFTLRAIERAHGSDPAIGQCFERMVESARRRRDRVPPASAPIRRLGWG